MTGTAELIAVVDAVTSALRRAGVGYFITGSLASSVHGEFRATNDLDIVAALDREQVSSILDALAGEFVVDRDQAATALASGGSFNLIHRETYLKVDLFPCVSPFEREAVRRAVSITLPGCREPMCVASREDILLAKLRWYRLGGDESERQWRDIRGLLALNSGRFDEAYLREWAVRLGVADLLTRLLPSS